METRTSDQYNFQFYNNYVIVEAKEGAIVKSEEIEKNLDIVFGYYKGRNFTIISNRKNNYTLEVDVYNNRLMKKVKAIAIVSTDSLARKKAELEQLHFNNSFAFFDNLEDAKDWAQNVTNY